MKGLHGRTVLVTRPRGRAGGLCRALRRAGARVMEAPAIRVCPLKAPALLEGRYDAAAFTSVNGVESFFSQAPKARRPAVLWAVGPATSAALARHGWKGSRVPPFFDGAALARSMVRAGVRGKRVLIPRAESGGRTLPEALRKAGARVTVAPVYRIERDPSLRSAPKRADWVTFSSPSAVEAFLDAAGPAMRRAKAAAIGPVTAAALRRRGIEPAAVASPHTDAGLVRAMARREDETPDALQRTLLEALRQGGAMLRRHWGKVRWGYKGRANLITQADHASEDRVLAVILGRHPDHGFVTEERPPRTGASEYVWTIDPLDGTTNFAHGNPVCCVSIGLSKGGQPFMAGVHDPFRREIFFARRGCGASLNGKPIRVSRVRSLEESLLVTGFAYDRAERSRFYLEYYRRFMERCHDVRRSGSAALDLAWTAAGRVDGFWEFKLSPWDVAAGWLLVTEAGGKVTDFSGKPWTGQGDLGAQTLATNGKIHRQMLKVLQPRTCTRLRRGAWSPSPRMGPRRSRAGTV